MPRSLQQFRGLGCVLRICMQGQRSLREEEPARESGIPCSHLSVRIDVSPCFFTLSQVCVRAVLVTCDTHCRPSHWKTCLSLSLRILTFKFGHIRSMPLLQLVKIT